MKKKLKKENVQFRKSDFDLSGGRLDQMSIEIFEEKLHLTLMGVLKNIQNKDMLYVQFNLSDPVALIFSTEKPASDKYLICVEKANAFFGTSRKSRQAFYKVRILNPITEIYNVNDKKT